MRTLAGQLCLGIRRLGFVASSGGRGMIQAPVPGMMTMRTELTLSEQLSRDELELAGLYKIMEDLTDQGEFGQPMAVVFQQIETIKNRWGGKTPMQWRDEARADIQAASPTTTTTP